jgi:hypothetical protein
MYCYYGSGLDLSRWRDKSDISYFYPADLAGSLDLAWYSGPISSCFTTSCGLNCGLFSARTPGQRRAGIGQTYRINAQRGNWRLYIRRSLGRCPHVMRYFPKTLKGVLRVLCEVMRLGWFSFQFWQWITRGPLSELLSRFAAMITQHSSSLTCCRTFMWRII